MALYSQFTYNRNPHAVHFMMYAYVSFIIRVFISNSKLRRNFRSIVYIMLQARRFYVSYAVPIHIFKVAKYRHMYRAEPKEPTQYGSVSGSEIKNLPFSLSGIVSLYLSEP